MGYLEGFGVGFKVGFGVGMGVGKSVGLIVGGGVGIAGNLNANGNIVGANITTTGIMSSTGNAILGNILTAGLISATGNVTGNYILGNGSQLTGITANYSNSNVSAFLAAFGSNTVSTSGNITAGNITGNINITGNREFVYSSKGEIVYLDSIKSIFESYSPQKRRKIWFETIRDELIEKSHEPSRYYKWCLDIEDMFRIAKLFII